MLAATTFDYGACLTRYFVLGLTQPDDGHTSSWARVKQPGGNTPISDNRAIEGHQKPGPPTIKAAFPAGDSLLGDLCQGVQEVHALVARYRQMASTKWRTGRTSVWHPLQPAVKLPFGCDDGRQYEILRAVKAHCL